MEGWDQTTLGDVCQIELGRTPARKDPTLWDTKKASDNVWLSIADLPTAVNAVARDSKEYISDSAATQGRLVPKGTLLVSFKLTLGRLAFAGRDLFTNEAIASLTIRDARKTSSQFLYWYLTYFDWEKAAEGDEKIKGKTLNKAKLKVLPVILPPLPEQERIVAILDEAFAAIATATANAEKNLANARELFESQLERAFSGGDSGDVVMEGWELSKLEAVSESVDYGHTASAEIDGSGPKFLRITDIQDGSVDWHNVPTCTCDLNDQAKYRLESGDIVFARTGATTGKSFLIDECPEAAVFASYLIRVRPSKEVLPDYLAHYFYSPMYWEQITKSATGSAQPGVNASKLKQLQVPLPPLPEQERIVAILDEASAHSKQLEQISTDKLDHLTNLKQSLLHKAFTGELTADKKAVDRTLSEAGV